MSEGPFLRDAVHFSFTGYKETDEINKAIDSVDEILTDLSDSLKFRYKHILSSQLSLPQCHDKGRTHRETKSPNSLPLNQKKNQRYIQGSIHKTRGVDRLNNILSPHTKIMKKIAMDINKTDLNEFKYKMKQIVDNSRVLSENNETEELVKKKEKNNEKNVVHTYESRKIDLLKENLNRHTECKANDLDNIPVYCQKTTKSSFGQYVNDKDIFIERPKKTYHDNDKRKDNTYEANYNTFTGIQTEIDINPHLYNPPEIKKELLPDSDMHLVKNNIESIITRNYLKIEDVNQTQLRRPNSTKCSAIIDRVTIKSVDEEGKVPGQQTTSCTENDKDKCYAHDHVQFRRLPDNEEQQINQYAPTFTGNETPQLGLTYLNFDDRHELDNNQIQPITSRETKARNPNLANKSKEKKDYSEQKWTAVNDCLSWHRENIDTSPTHDLLKQDITCDTDVTKTKNIPVHIKQEISTDNDKANISGDVKLRQDGLFLARTPYFDIDNNKTYQNQDSIEERHSQINSAITKCLRRSVKVDNDTIATLESSNQSDKQTSLSRPRWNAIDECLEWHREKRERTVLNPIEQNNMNGRFSDMVNVNSLNRFYRLETKEGNKEEYNENFQTDYKIKSQVDSVDAERSLVFRKFENSRGAIKDDDIINLPVAGCSRQDTQTSNSDGKKKNTSDKQQSFDEQLADPYASALSRKEMLQRDIIILNKVDDINNRDEDRRAYIPLNETTPLKENDSDERNEKLVKEEYNSNIPSHKETMSPRYSIAEEKKYQIYSSNAETPLSSFNTTKGEEAGDTKYIYINYINPNDRSSELPTNAVRRLDDKNNYVSVQGGKGVPYNEGHEDARDRRHDIYTQAITCDIDSAEAERLTAFHYSGTPIETINNLTGLPSSSGTSGERMDEHLMKVKHRLKAVISKLKNSFTPDHMENLERAEVLLTAEIERVLTQRNHTDYSRVRSDIYRLIKHLQTAVIESGAEPCRQDILYTLQEITSVISANTDIQPTLSQERSEARADTDGLKTG